MLAVTSSDSGDESKSSVHSLYYEAHEDDDEQSSVSMTPEEAKRQKRLTSERLLVRWRQRAGDFVNNTTVQFIVIGLITINALMMALATFDFVTDDPIVEKVFETIDIVFLSVFTVELALQFIYHGLTLFQDGWLVFDFVVVILSWSFTKTQVIRAFRVFRAFRLVTRVKVLRNLVTAIMVVLPRMTAIGSLLMLFFYVFSVLFVELFGELELSGNYFKTLDASLFTCFQMMTMEWADLARECQESLSYAPIIFVCFIMITGFIGKSLHALKRNTRLKLSHVIITFCSIQFDHCRCMRCCRCGRRDGT
jgi:uncharacterized membrane protein YphA (DoxX/SURF4 family)